MPHPGNHRTGGGADVRRTPTLDESAGLEVTVVTGHKAVRLARTDPSPASRPVMLAIAGDSAAGKTTLTRGIAAALGAERTSVICVDDYHRYDREERKQVPFTVLNPDCNYIEIMEQHLQLLAMGRPVLKPLYDHSQGRLVRPVLV